MKQNSILDFKTNGGCGVTVRFMVMAVIQFFVLLPTTHFAELRDYRIYSSGSTTTSRSLHLAPDNGFSVTPTSISASPEATNGTLSVVSQDGGELNISNPVPWITVSPSAARTANQTNETLVYSISPNPSCSNRTGVFYIETQAVTVSQAGVASSYALSSSTASFTTNGGSGSVSLSANCLWSLQSDANWISITSTTSGSDNGTISYSVALNSGNNARSGTIKVRDGNSVVRATLNITQNGVPVTHSLNSTNATFTAAGGNSNVVLTATEAWTAQSDGHWIANISPSSGNGSATISYTVDPNSTPSARTGTIKIIGANSVVKQILTIGQSAASANYSLSASNAAFSADGGSSNVVLSSTSNWQVQSDVPWITGITPTTGVGNATISYTVAANTSCESRSGLVKILNGSSVVQKTLLVTQAGITGNYTLSSTYILFPYNGGRISVGLSARCNWTVQTDVPWISNISPASGNTNATIYYTVAENTNTKERQGFIRILDAAGVVQQTLKIAQTGTGGFDTAAAESAPSAPTDSSYAWANNDGTGKAQVTDVDGSVVSAGSVDGNIYLQKYAVDGTQLWLKWFMGGVGQVSAIALDANGNVYLSGVFSGSIDFGSGALNSSDAADIYLAAYNADGAALWSKTFAGAGEDYVQSIGVSADNVVVVGSFSSQIKFGEATENQLVTAESSDVFLTEFALGNGEPLSAQLLGNLSVQDANGVALEFLRQYTP